MIQDLISNWIGPELPETSSMLVHEGALHKISAGHCQERYFYLFDHLLVYCKRNVLGNLILKGRIPTASLQVTDLANGKHDGRTLAHAMKMVNAKKDKTYTVFATTKEEKAMWLNAFVPSLCTPIEGHVA